MRKKIKNKLIVDKSESKTHEQRKRSRTENESLEEIHQHSQKRKTNNFQQAYRLLSKSIVPVDDTSLAFRFETFYSGISFSCFFFLFHCHIFFFHQREIL